MNMQPQSSFTVRSLSFSSKALKTMSFVSIVIFSMLIPFLSGCDKTDSEPVLEPSESVTTDDPNTSEDPDDTNGSDVNDPYAVQQNFLIGSSWEDNYSSHRTIIFWDLLFYPDMTGRYKRNYTYYTDDYKTDVYETEKIEVEFEYEFTDTNELRIYEKIDNQSGNDDSSETDSGKSEMISLWKYNIEVYEHNSETLPRRLRLEFVDGEVNRIGGLPHVDWWILDD